MTASERLIPATGRQIAVELEKLRSVFGYEAAAWETAVGLYIDALADMPADLLADAVATCVRLAGADDHFPKPGQIRALVRESLELRKDQAQRESRKGRDEEAWPNWLREIWGPEPQGPIARKQALAAQEQQRLMPIWHDSLPPPPQAPEGDFKRIADVLGVTATEQKPKPKYEDPEELRRGRIALGLEENPRDDQKGFGDE